MWRVYDSYDLLKFPRSGLRVNSCQAQIAEGLPLKGSARWPKSRTGSFLWQRFAPHSIFLHFHFYTWQMHEPLFRQPKEHFWPLTCSSSIKLYINVAQQPFPPPFSPVSALGTRYRIARLTCYLSIAQNQKAIFEPRGLDHDWQQHVFVHTLKCVPHVSRFPCRYDHITCRSVPIKET